MINIDEPLSKCFDGTSWVLEPGATAREESIGTTRRELRTLHADATHQEVEHGHLEIKRHPIDQAVRKQERTPSTYPPWPSFPYSSVLHYFVPGFTCRSHGLRTSANLYALSHSAGRTKLRCRYLQPQHDGETRYCIIECSSYSVDGTNNRTGAHV